MTRPRLYALLPVLALLACPASDGSTTGASDSDGPTGGASEPTAGTANPPTTGGTGDTSGTGDDTGETPAGPYARCGAGIVDSVSGQIDAARYEQVARDWSEEAVNCRLGPTWAELHDGDATNPAPEVWGPAGQTCDGGYLTDGIPVQAGVCPEGGGCYGSVSGQALYVPAAGLGAATPGVDRIQTHAWEQGAISSHPKMLSSPEPYVTRPEYDPAALGQPIAIARSERNWTNDGVAIFAGGAVGTAGTATSGSVGAYYQFPPHLVPSAVAITSNNEFVLVTLWNTDEVRGELAVLSVRGPTPNAHSWWYHGLFNAGGVRELKLLGTVPLPLATPTSIAAVTTHGWTNPNDAGGKSMRSLSFTGPHKDTMVDTCFTSEAQMSDVANQQPISAFAEGGSLQHLVARKGYALVASQWEDKVAFVDLAPLLDYFHSMYFGSEASCTETLSQFVWDGMQAGDQVLPQAPADVWPYTFDVAPESARPTVAAVFDVTAPRAVRVGLDKSQAIYGPTGGVDVWKAYAAGDDGVLHVFTPGRLMASWFEVGKGEQATGEPAPLATGQICQHPTALVMHRGLEGDRSSFLAIVPEEVEGETQEVRGLNDGVIVVCRGERALQHVVAWKDEVEVYEEIRDGRMNDPVAVWYSDRADVRTVADFTGRKLLSYRFGRVKIEDWKEGGCGPQGAEYGPGEDGMGDHEFAGELAIAGSPFQVSVANVN
ncbi:hypothetical protein [Nannocystis pusilla]|uniref:hypothetical protein n=1 Tax=Nannocystis pusilla TaxID=889268 RepID=UPI003DA2EBDE